MRFWKSCPSCTSSACTTGIASWVTTAPASSIAERRLNSARRSAASLETAFKSWLLVPTRE
jgi:hypothetical protein